MKIQSKSNQMEKVLFINGPNLGLLGIRQPEIYGTTTLDDITTQLEHRCVSSGLILDSFQSDSEGELISKLGEEYRTFKTAKNSLLGIIINPGGLTHTSIALRDALEMYSADQIKIVEVHLSNIYRREEFRTKSVTAPVANAMITGMGPYGYYAALDYLLTR